MPRLTKKLPSYRLHKASGHAIVTLAGRDHYLGPRSSRLTRKPCGLHAADFRMDRPGANPSQPPARQAAGPVPASGHPVRTSESANCSRPITSTPIATT